MSWSTNNQPITFLCTASLSLSESRELRGRHLWVPSGVGPRGRAHGADLLRPWHAVWDLRPDTCYSLLLQTTGIIVTEGFFYLHHIYCSTILLNCGTIYCWCEIFCWASYTDGASKVHPAYTFIMPFNSIRNVLCFWLDL